MILGQSAATAAAMAIDAQVPCRTCRIPKLRARLSAMADPRIHGRTLRIIGGREAVR